MQMDKGKLSLPFPDHIGFLVKDVDKAIEILSSTWGFGPWQIFEFVEEREVVSGEPVKFKVAAAKLGAVVLEFVQQTAGGGMWAEFVERTGGGIHHMAFGFSNWDEEVARLKEQGYKMIAGGKTAEGNHWCFFDIKSAGIVIELMEDIALKDMF